MAIAMAHINEMPPALPESVDPRVQNLVLSCLAKKPSQRPESAVTLAIRAEALLREKVQPSLAPTPLAQLNATQATELIGTDTAEMPKAPVVWPWIATLALLVLTTVVVLVAIISEPRINPDIEPTPLPTQTQNGGDPEPEPEPEPEPQSALLLRSDYIGESISEVTARLTGLGFEVNAIPGEVLEPGDPRIRTVYAISPTGTIALGTAIDITYYVARVTEGPIDVPTTEPDPVAPEPTDPANGEDNNPDSGAGETDGQSD
jgi:serine/threonine-protein kinase